LLTASYSIDMHGAGKPDTFIKKKTVLNTRQKAMRQIGATTSRRDGPPAYEALGAFA
jgi:hypothetical protein